MTHQVLILNNISQKGLDLLPSENYTISEDASEPDAILLRSYKMHDMEIPKSLLAVGRAGAGVNNIPIDKMSDNGVVVFNAPGANANAVKELVIAAMLMACRNLTDAKDYVDQLEGEDNELHKQVEAGKKKFAGYELPNRTLGVVGLGAIGVEIANTARDLGMNVIGYDPRIQIKYAWKLSSGVQPVDTVDELLQQSDFVTFHVPLLESTKDLINSESIQSMKKDAVVLNFARDGIVNDKAVVEALESGKLQAYVCDFPSNAIKGKKGVIALPHLGASTTEAEVNCATMVSQQVLDYIENGTIKNSVNLPDTKLARAGKVRLSIVHNNIPDMVGKISSLLSQSSINIRHMTNNSQNNMAYTLIDIDTDLDSSTLNALNAIEGVLKARAL
ncbi:MAG: 3-phosphoglycerate dehydrogenase [Thiotrichaceae bacterium]|nr:3-phosphoglycerate dehydrogenase [Thiotrichaceae bacterium]